MLTVFGKKPKTPTICTGMFLCNSNLIECFSVFFSFDFSMIELYWPVNPVRFLQKSLKAFKTNQTKFADPVKLQTSEPSAS